MRLLGILWKRIRKRQTIKRIIGLPNEKVEIIDGKVYIDDSISPLNEVFIKGFASGNFGPFNVPDNN